MKKTFICTLLILWACFIQAQSFNSLKRETAKPYVPELHTLVINNDIEGMRNNLRVTPANANNGSVYFDGKQLSRWEKTGGTTMPLLFDVINNCIAGVCSYEMLDVVLDAKADMYTPFEGMPPLYFLLDYIAVTPKILCGTQEAILQKLIEHKIDVKTKFRDKPAPLAYLMQRTRNYVGKYSPLYVSDEVLKMLIEAGADINSYDSEGNNLLTFVLETQNSEMEDYLFSKGINIKGGNNSDVEPFYQAIDNNNISVVKRILETGYKCDVRELSNRLAKLKANPEMCTIIIDHCLLQVHSWSDATLFYNRLGSISEATNKLENKIKQDFLYNGTTDNKAVYLNYISYFPNGQNISLAKRRLKEIIDKEDNDKFTSVCNVNTPEAYKEYLREYPYGLHTKEVKSRAFDIESQNLLNLYNICKANVNKLDQRNEILDKNSRFADDYVSFYSDMASQKQIQMAADVKVFMYIYSFMTHSFRSDYTRSGYERKIAINRGLQGIRRNSGLFGALLIACIQKPVGVEDVIDFPAIDRDINSLKDAANYIDFFCTEYKVSSSDKNRYYQRIEQKKNEIAENANKSYQKVARVWDKWDKTFMSTSSVTESINLALNKKYDENSRQGQATLLKMFGLNTSADEIKRTQCSQCIIDEDATYDENHRRSDTDKWAIVMKNGNKYEYTVNGKGKYVFIGTGFFNDDEFDKPEQLIDRMLQNCRIRYCL